MASKKITVLDPRGQPSGIYGKALNPESDMMELLNPFAQPEGTLERVKMAPRLSSLDGKTVYLIDTGFAGARDFMEEVQGWFSQNRPDIKTVLRSKAGNTFATDPVLWKEIKEKGDAVVFGVGS